MKMLVGVLYCYLWYTSILAGYLCLYCFIIPLLFVSNRLYRYCTDVIFTFWQAYPTVLLQLLCECDIDVTGNYIESNEMSILIMNHRTRTDWNFLWPVLYHSTRGINKYRFSTKFLLKDAVKYFPGPDNLNAIENEYLSRKKNPPEFILYRVILFIVIIISVGFLQVGWVMQLTSSIFIKRSWNHDKNILENFCRYIKMLSYKCSVLMFPEGTDFTEETKKKSDKYAEKNDLPKYEHILHPRTTGFAFLASKLLDDKCLDAVYDLTLVYPDIAPQTEKLIFQGYFPKRVRVHIVRYSSAMLPKSEDGLRKFLKDKWNEKEKTLDDYFAKGQFISEPRLTNRRNYVLYLAFIFWTVIPYITFYLLINNSIFRYMCIVHSVFLIVVSLFTPGFQYFEILVYDFKKLFLGPKLIF